MGCKSAPAEETLCDGLYHFYQFQCHILSSPSVFLGTGPLLGAWWSFTVKTREHLLLFYIHFIMKMSPLETSQCLLEEECPSIYLWLQSIMGTTSVRQTMAWGPNAVRWWHSTSQVGHVQNLSVDQLHLCQVTACLFFSLNFPVP